MKCQDEEYVKQLDDGSNGSNDLQYGTKYAGIGFRAITGPCVFNIFTQLHYTQAPLVRISFINNLIGMVWYGMV